jgi:hypothetical protein
MSSETTPDAVVLRDQAGVWYLLTGESLAVAQATAEQQAALDDQLGGDTTGFVMIHAHIPFQMVGAATLPGAAPTPITPQDPAAARGIIIIC